MIVTARIWIVTSKALSTPVALIALTGSFIFLTIIRLLYHRLVSVSFFDTLLTINSRMILIAELNSPTAVE